MLEEPCASCHMRCCTHFTIPVSISDIGRICGKLKCSPWDFCGLVAADSIEQPLHANVFLFDEKGGMWEMSLVLKKKSDGSCTFFRSVQGCPIHGFHPMACRAYPFVSGAKSGLKYNRHFICPRKWKEGEHDREETRDILDKFEKETELHDKFVREWNAKHARKNAGKDAEKAFLEFLMKAAGNA